MYIALTPEQAKQILSKGWINMTPYEKSWGRRAIRTIANSCLKPIESIED